jgi:hypothetical protein
MKNKIFILSLLILFSCNKITPENIINKDIKQDNIINKIPNSIPNEEIKQE